MSKRAGSRTLPRGRPSTILKVDKATFEEAKTGLTTIKQTWAEAQEDFKGGKVADAVAKGNSVKEKTAEIMTKLGMQVPAAAKS
jgi:hypothetical protein